MSYTIRPLDATRGRQVGKHGWIVSRVVDPV